jgi:hypothetical protein
MNNKQGCEKIPYLDMDEHCKHIFNCFFKGKVSRDTFGSKFHTRLWVVHSMSHKEPLKE